jgi:hypothetical protein
MRFVFPGYADPLSFFTYCKMGLDYLIVEGASHPAMMTVGLHPRWTGHPARAAAVEKFLAYAIDTDVVWIAPRIEIARWWLKTQPASAQPSRRR